MNDKQPTITQAQDSTIPRGFQGFPPDSAPMPQGELRVTPQPIGSAKVVGVPFDPEFPAMDPHCAETLTGFPFAAVEGLQHELDNRADASWGVGVEREQLVKVLDWIKRFVPIPVDSIRSETMIGGVFVVTIADDSDRNDDVELVRLGDRTFVPETPMFAADQDDPLVDRVATMLDDWQGGAELAGGESSQELAESIVGAIMPEVLARAAIHAHAVGFDWPKSDEATA